MTASSTPLVSAIIATYNGEDFLEECIDSILAQTLEEFELICVNDGSVDSTPTILARYESLDDRVRVFTQDNAGVSSARNKGLSHARGEFVLFLDDDDVFLPAMFEKMAQKMCLTGADLCVTNGNRFNMKTESTTKGKSYLRMDYVPDGDSFTPEDAGKYLLNFSTFHVFNKMFRRSFLLENGIEFQPVPIGEDSIFYVQSLIAARKITVVDDHLFVYRFNTGTSVTDSVYRLDMLAGYKSGLRIKQMLIDGGMYKEPFKQSCVNKALASAFHYQRRARDFESFSLWFDKMVLDGGLSDLDILDHESEYFYNEKEAADLEVLASCQSAGDYVFNLYEAKQDELQRLKTKNADLRRANKDAKASLKRTQSELKQLKDSSVRVNPKMKRTLKKLRGAVRGACGSR